MNRKQMMMGAVGSLVGALLLCAGIAMADGDRWQGWNDDMPRDNWMTLTELAEQLETQGYTPYEIEIDDGAYEVRMLDTRGMMIESYFNPTTGEPLRRWAY